MLSQGGVEAELEVQRGALTFLVQGPEMFARFDPRAQLRGTRATVTQALAQGFNGVRLCGSSPYSPPAAVVDERAWIEFEALLSDACPSWKTITICRHDLRRNQPSFLREMLRVHRKAILGPLVCPNPFFEPPDMVIGKASDDERLRWMIEQVGNARIARRSLEHAVQARDDFMSAASHELRTPITSTVLGLEHLLRQTEREPDEHVAKSSVVSGLRRLQERFRRFVEVVQRLVDASQLRDEMVELRVEPVDLTAVTRSALERCKELLRRTHSEVNLLSPDESIVGQWDRMRLEQIVASLVENAAKFGESKPIDVIVSRCDDVGRLVVRDHGVGIRSEDIPRIYECFERGVPVSHYGGFGLGLWIAKTLVEAFGGRIGVDTALGMGTTFVVDLPLSVGQDRPAT
jgi:signal transduction histidine kinase